MPVKQGDFLKIKTDEGPEISGIVTDSCYDDCHHPTYTGEILANLSNGIFSREIIFDSDHRDKRDGYHISREDQLKILSDESLKADLEIMRVFGSRRIKVTRGLGE